MKEGSKCLKPMLIELLICCAAPAMLQSMSIPASTASKWMVKWCILERAWICWSVLRSTLWE